MTNPIVADSGLLGKIVYPRGNPEAEAWFEQILEQDVNLILAEIADYELRRELLHHGFTASISRLNQLKSLMTYLPLNTAVMLKAAELWAEARKRGRPTADPKSLDVDVILAAQALQVNGIVATENVRHLSLFVEAKHWRDIS
jgi:predicted nucleic acid-binding protein